MVSRPIDFTEALKILDTEDTIVLAGGTDLMIKKKRQSGLLPAFEKNTVFIAHLKELKKIYKNDKYLYIGAACTLTELVESDLIPEYMKKVILDMASPAIRNIATIGGNICNSSPAADILPLLYALETELILENIHEQRTISIETFILGPSKNTLGRNEILKELKLPIVEFDSFYYKKVGTRKATAISKLSFIGFVKFQDNKIEDIRFAFGAVAPTIVKSKKIEDGLKNINKKDIQFKISEVQNEYSKLLKPIDDQRSNSAYRLKVSLNLLEDFIKNLCQ